jgi:hypothetical protein
MNDTQVTPERTHQAVWEVTKRELGFDLVTAAT